MQALPLFVPRLLRQSPLAWARGRVWIRLALLLVLLFCRVSSLWGAVRSAAQGEVFHREVQEGAFRREVQEEVFRREVQEEVFHREGVQEGVREGTFRLEVQEGVFHLEVQEGVFRQRPLRL